jgi:hypothetical protein
VKRLHSIIVIVFFGLNGFGQNHVTKEMVDSLSRVPFLYSDTLDCNANLYWRIVARGEEAIPYLIAKLTDTLPTNIKFHCKKGRLNVGEVSYFAIHEIGYFPMFLVTQMQFDLFEPDPTGGLCFT